MKILLERFEEKIYYAIDGCWYWTGSLSNKGYGRILVNGKNALASRVSYQLYKGDPSSLFVCHHCDNPACVNPDHLFLGTAVDNMRDMANKGRNFKPVFKPYVDLSGRVFHRLTVLSRGHKKNNNYTWHCRCLCGNETYVLHSHLVGETTKSCGCGKINHHVKKNKRREVV